MPCILLGLLSICPTTALCVKEAVLLFVFDSRETKIRIRSLDSVYLTTAPIRDLAYR